MARATIGVALFLLLLIPAKAVGLNSLYAKPVLAVAQAIFVPTQHFPLLARLDNLEMRNLEFGVVLAFSLFVVSTRLRIGARVTRFGLLFLALFTFHVTITILSTKVWVTQDLLNRTGVQVLSTAEFRVLDWLKYFFYDLGLETASFAMLLVTVVWNVNSGRERRVRTAPRRRGRALAAAAAIAGTLTLAGFVHGRYREADPRHVEAHARIGHFFWNSQMEDQARKQYEIAVAGGTTDPQVYFNLARLAIRKGNREESLRLLEQGAVFVRDDSWASLFQKAIALSRPR